ncbi:MAG: pyridoxal-phosphate-dependent aminotransferase family protein [Bacillota bacterium]
MARKYGSEVLLTPGPVEVPQRVLEASARPLIHYASKRLFDKVKFITEGMKAMFGTSGDVLLISGSGRTGLEATVCSLFSPGEEVLCLSNGRFGLMYAGIFEKYGIAVTRVAQDWTKDYDPAEVVEALKANPKIKAISAPFCETSTGVLNDLVTLGKIAREHGKLLLVDAVSSAGGVDFRFDEWGVDAVVTGSQKGIMSPPGLSFVALSDRAWKAAETATLPCSYLDLRAMKRALWADFPGMPGTPPITLVLAVAEAISMLLEEGLPEVYRRYEKMAAAVRAGFVAAGLKLFPENVKRRSPTVTVVESPAGHEARELVNVMTGEFGLIPATGLGSYSKSVLRFGTMGAFYQKEAINMVATVEAALVKMGINKEAGAGVRACVASLFSE